MKFEIRKAFRKGSNDYHGGGDQFEANVTGVINQGGLSNLTFLSDDVLSIGLTEGGYVKQNDGFLVVWGEK